MSQTGKIWIAVPTYWTFAAGAEGRELTVFDHPTPVSESGTLARTLETFKGLKGEFAVLVVAAATNPVIGDQVHARVAEILKPFAADLELYLVSPQNLAAVNALFPENLLRLDSYGNIRNVQLALPYAAGARMVIGIDDDELVTDPDYVGKVAAAVGSQYQGQVVAGIAGPYFDRNGEYRIGGAEALQSCPNMFIKKNYFMNEALKKVMAFAGKGAMVRSNVAFGGNMAMARETIARVCHDPYIPRGEDYDYVINAAMAGLFYCFLPDAGIVHLPPDSTGSQAADKDSKLLADIRRFLYMREKHELHQRQYPQDAFDVAYLLPYPGSYLDAGIDLKAHAVDAIRQKLTHWIADPEGYVQEAVQTAETKAREFFAYQEVWRRALPQANHGRCPALLDGTLRVKA